MKPTLPIVTGYSTSIEAYWGVVLPLPETSPLRKAAPHQPTNDSARMHPLGLHDSRFIYHEPPFPVGGLQ